MSLLFTILASLGFCPSKKGASGFKPSPNDIRSINPTRLLKPQSLLLLILIARGGYLAFFATMSFIRRMGLYPSTMFEIVVYSLGFLWGASLVLLTLDVYISKQMTTRHYIEASLFILVSGLSSIQGMKDFLIYLSTIRRYPYMTFNWGVAFQMNDNFLLFVPMLIAFYLAYRVFRQRPLFVKSTYLLLIGMCLSRIIWLMSIYNISQLRLTSPWGVYNLMMLILGVATLGFAFISFLQGYKGKWSKKELYSQGIPRFFKLAIFTYGLQQLVSMSSIFLGSDGFWSVFSNSQVLVSVVARLAIGLSTMFLSMINWNLSSIFPNHVQEKI